jgi:hypothetical protein
MTTITITIEGAAELQRKIGMMDVLALLRRPMEKSMIRLQSRMATYPPQRPGSTYRRTGRLGRSWTYAITTMTNSLVGKVGNNVVYAPRVQSKRFQQRAFKGRWQTNEDVLQQETLGIIRDFTQGIQDGIKSAGLAR